MCVHHQVLKILHQDNFKNWIPLQCILFSDFYQIFTPQIVFKEKFPDFSLTFSGSFQLPLTFIEITDNDKLWDEITYPFPKLQRLHHWSLGICK